MDAQCGIPARKPNNSSEIIVWDYSRRSRERIIGKRGWMVTAFERATEIAADELARCRTGYDSPDDVAPTENEILLAGHIVGRLWGNNLLDLTGEKWRTIESIMWPQWLNTMSRFVHDRFGF